MTKEVETLNKLSALQMPCVQFLRILTKISLFSKHHSVVSSYKTVPGTTAIVMVQGTLPSKASACLLQIDRTSIHLRHATAMLLINKYFTLRNLKKHSRSTENTIALKSTFKSSMVTRRAFVLRSGQSDMIIWLSWDGAGGAWKTKFVATVKKNWVQRRFRDRFPPYVGDRHYFCVYESMHCSFSRLINTSGFVPQLHRGHYNTVYARRVDP